MRATFLELASDEEPPVRTACDKWLEAQLRVWEGSGGEALRLHPKADEISSYRIEFILNPRAWGQSRATAPTIIWIDKNPDTLAQAIARELHSAFVLGSWHLVDQLGVGVFGVQTFNRLREYGPGGKLHGGLSGDKLHEFLEGRVAQERRPLWEAYGAARQALQRKAISYEDLIEEYACCRALREELPACDNATLGEARRYLSLDRLGDAEVRKALKPGGPLTHALTGPDGRGLMAAVRSLAGPLQKLRAAQQRMADLMPGSTSEMIKQNLWMTMLGPLAFPFQAQRYLRQYRAAVAGDSPRAAVALDLARQSTAFQELYTTYASSYPILNKVGDFIDEAAAKLGEGPFTRRVVEALGDALQASEELSGVLAQEPSKVWRFPGLVNRSVARGFSGDLPFAQRVAANRLLKENETPFFARLNAGIQLLDSTLTLVPSPHVKVAMLLATVVGDAAELLESYFQTAEQRLGYRAAVDPSRALGPDASYTSTLLQTAFLGLGLLPIKGAAREWVEETAHAAKARKARQLALQGAM